MNKKLIVIPVISIVLIIVGGGMLFIKWSGSSSKSTDTKPLSFQIIEDKEYSLPEEITNTNIKNGNLVEINKDKITILVEENKKTYELDSNTEFFKYESFSSDELSVGDDLFVFGTIEDEEHYSQGFTLVQNEWDIVNFEDVTIDFEAEGEISDKTLDYVELDLEDYYHYENGFGFFDYINVHLQDNGYVLLRSDYSDVSDSALIDLRVGKDEIVNKVYFQNL